MLHVKDCWYGEVQSKLCPECIRFGLEFTIQTVVGENENSLRVDELQAHYPLVVRIDVDSK